MSEPWIKTAIKHHGALTAAAKKAGMSTHEYAKKHKDDKGTLGRRARLALTLAEMHEADAAEQPQRAPMTMGSNATE